MLLEFERGEGKKVEEVKKEERRRVVGGKREEGGGGGKRVVEGWRGRRGWGGREREKRKGTEPSVVSKFLYSGLALPLSSSLSSSLSLPGYVEATLDAVPPGDKPLPATELPRNIDRAFR